MFTKKLPLIIALTFLTAWPAFAQYGALSKEQRILYTQQNPYERFEDGRPRVPDDILERMKKSHDRGSLECSPPKWLPSSI